jgi:hypothetical protein
VVLHLVFVTASHLTRRQPPKATALQVASAADNVGGEKFSVYKRTVRSGRGGGLLSATVSVSLLCLATRIPAVRNYKSSLSSIADRDL